MNDITSFLGNILKFLNGTIVPFILAVAFLMFLVNAYRYFILGGANEKSQEQAKQLALWGILAFVFILSIWGIVNLFVSGLGLSPTPLSPDAFELPY